uniref:protein seele n=1 Tax=Erigeron canadensis TaxID=72917 RepID=UPI001CB8AC13|nr:protein seele [Erigeron canadensis]
MAVTAALRRLIFAVTIFIAVSVGHSIHDKCRACNAVAEELELGMMKEKPKNHLDMRHRLDSTGQRRGKVIDYRVSELRVTDLLDGLCDKMQDYTLQKIDSNKKLWMKVDDWDDITSNKQESRAYSKEISSYCGRLLEETEDELAELIMKGSFKVGEVSKILCHDLSNHCKQSSENHQSSHDDEDDDEVHGEL